MDESVKILCVDDEQNVLSALKRLFLDDDYSILTASSGQEGISVLENEQAQIVISDYRMPAMNGVEFLREVYKRWPDTVRIVLSGYADTAAIVSAINEGQIYKFIPKPWNDDELKVTVVNAIERYSLYKKNTELTSELKAKNEELIQLNSELEKLLKFKTANLELRNKFLVSHQNIIDSMPVGVVGVDINNVVVLTNAEWQRHMGSRGYVLGQSVEEAFPEELVRFIERVKVMQKGAMKINTDDFHGTLLGVLMEYDSSQKGIIIVCCPGETYCA
ncbi:MAG: response regulator [Nitrospirae bacterium]|nr:response regulator [Nitrospirota bacterium]